MAAMRTCLECGAELTPGTLDGLCPKCIGKVTFGLNPSGEPVPRPLAAEELEKLCRTCWHPLYAYVRRRGHDAQEAQDLTQAFFAHLLEKNYLANANPGAAGFHSLLLSELRRFLVNERERARAGKCGGQVPISLDADTAKTRHRLEPTTETPPDWIYEEHWALVMLGQALARLKEEQQAEDKAKRCS